MEEDFFCQCYSICQREVFMIQVFRNNDKLSTRFFLFSARRTEGRADSVGMFLFFFYQNKILYFNTIKCLLCQIRYLRF